MADPNDPRLWIHLAIQIHNKGYYRTRLGTIDGPFPKKARIAAMVPFGGKAAELSTSTAQIQDIVKILVRADAVEAAQAIASGQVPAGDFDTAAIDYIVSKIKQEQRKNKHSPERQRIALPDKESASLRSAPFLAGEHDVSK